jgi:hypothetical protein
MMACVNSRLLLSALCFLLDWLALGSRGHAGKSVAGYRKSADDEIVLGFLLPGRYDCCSIWPASYVCVLTWFTFSLSPPPLYCG